MEIIGLAKIEEKVSLVLKKLASIQLSTGLNDSYSHLLPSLLWSSICLNFKPNDDFTPIALSSALSNIDKIPFSSKVLLAQVCQHLKKRDESYIDDSNIESKVAHLEAMLHRHEQIEMKDNSREYKHLYGVDLALEL